MRAARHGHSIEADMRAILADALSRDEYAEPDLAAAIRRRFAPLGGVELEADPSVVSGGVAIRANPGDFARRCRLCRILCRKRSSQYVAPGSA